MFLEDIVFTVGGLEGNPVFVVDGSGPCQNDEIFIAMGPIRMAARTADIISLQLCTTPSCDGSGVVRARG